MRYELQWLNHSGIWGSVYSFHGDEAYAIKELTHARAMRPDVTFRMYDREARKDIEK